MAEGTARPRFFLSSLDPGLGKTTAIIHFIRHLMQSYTHLDVSVLICVSRLEEIERLVGEMGLQSDYAVLTSNDDKNAQSKAEPSDARVLFTTHSMVMSRCRGRSFEDEHLWSFSFTGRFAL